MPNLASTTAAEQAELIRLTRHAEIALAEAYNWQGINIGINLGRAAGAGVLHYYLLVKAADLPTAVAALRADAVVRRRSLNGQAPRSSGPSPPG